MLNSRGLLQIVEGAARIDVRAPVASWTSVLSAANDSDECRLILLEGGFPQQASGASPLGASMIAALAKPTIAVIDGACHDWGLELALACDLRLADERATFAMRQPHNGALPMDGGTQRLPRIVGRANALRLLLTGEVIDAQEAKAIGLIHATAPHDALAALASQTSTVIAAAAPLAAAYAKEAIGLARDLPLAQGLMAEHDLSALLQSTRDRAEGLTAWRKRRPPQFEGR